MRPDIVKTEKQAVREMLVDRGLHRVVVRNGIVVISSKVRPSRERSVSLLEFAIGHTIGDASCAGDLVKIGWELQIRAVASHVGKRRHITACELMLHAQLPFVDSPGLNIVRDISLT